MGTSLEIIPKHSVLVQHTNTMCTQEHVSKKKKKAKKKAEDENQKFATTNLSTAILFWEVV